MKSSYLRHQSQKNNSRVTSRRNLKVRFRLCEGLEFIKKLNTDLDSISKGIDKFYRAKAHSNYVLPKISIPRYRTVESDRRVYRKKIGVTKTHRPKRSTSK